MLVNKVKSMGICKFCNQEKKLVKAHIVPRAFFEYIKGSGAKNRRGEVLEEITNRIDEYPIKTTIKGLYDSRLVCIDCEALFAPFDDYAIQLLLKSEEAHKPLIIDGEVKGWRISEFNYKKLQLFLISILWRAGASTLKQFERINLGPYLEIAKGAIASESLEGIEKFSVVLARFPDNLGRSIFLDPHMEGKKGAFPQLNVCRFYLGAGYIVYIKVDKRPFPTDFEVLKISNDKPLIILSRTFIGGREVSVIQKVYSDAEQLAKKWGK